MTKDKNFILHTFLFFVFSLFIFFFYNRYIYLVWNIFLAYIPFFLSFHYIKTKNILIKLVNIVVSLIFYPNCIYVFTDLIHISKMNYYSRSNGTIMYNMDFEIWYRFAIIFVAVIIALNMSYITIKNYTKNIKLESLKYLIYILVSILSGIAVFIGRFIRLNSWDLFIHPIQNTKIILSNISADTLPFILIFAFIQLFVIIIYEKR